MAPYSTRAKKGATVAAPITWGELEKAKSVDEYNLEVTLSSFNNFLLEDVKED